MSDKKNSDSFIFLTAVTVVGGLLLWIIIEGAKLAWKDDFLDIPDSFNEWWQNGGLNRFIYSGYYPLLVFSLLILTFVLFVTNDWLKERRKKKDLPKQPATIVHQDSANNGNSFKHYRQDVINHVLWKWDYDGNNIINLKGYCDYEGNPLQYDTRMVRQLDYKSRAMTGLKCAMCDAWHYPVVGGIPDLEKTVLLEIRHRIHKKCPLSKGS
jgi:hypothetical protein